MTSPKPHAGIIHVEIDDYEIARLIQQWSWKRRKKLSDGTPDFGSVAEAAKKFKIDPKYIADLIGRCGGDNILLTIIAHDIVPM